MTALALAGNVWRLQRILAGEARSLSARMFRSSRSSEFLSLIGAVSRREIPYRSVTVIEGLLVTLERAGPLGLGCRSRGA